MGNNDEVEVAKDSRDEVSSIDAEAIYKDLEINSDSINMYSCPEPDCLCIFQKYGNVHKYLDSGDHRMKRTTKHWLTNLK